MYCSRHAEVFDLDKVWRAVSRAGGVHVRARAALACSLSLHLVWDVIWPTKSSSVIVPVPARPRLRNALEGSAVPKTYQRVGSTSANRACPPQPIASRVSREATECISRVNPVAIRLKEYGALFSRPSCGLYFFPLKLAVTSATRLPSALAIARSSGVGCSSPRGPAIVVAP